MGTQFRHNGNPDTSARPIPGYDHCMCAQMADGWLNPATADAVLREAADPSCPSCKGAGRVPAELCYVEPEAMVDVNLEGSALVRGALGLGTESIGSVTLPNLRRAIARARERLNICPADWRERLEAYLDRFAELCDVAEARDATAVVWS